MAAFAGPGYLVAVGLHGPGQLGDRYRGRREVRLHAAQRDLLSNLMAILLQSLSARLGIASGRDLAQACRDAYSRRTTFVLWVLCEIAIAACDLAEVLGAAIALQLLVRHPATLGRVPHLARRSARALHAAPRLPSRRGDCHRADPRHRRMLCRGVVAGSAGYRRDGLRVWSRARRFSQTPRCSTSRSASSERR